MALEEARPARWTQQQQQQQQQRPLDWSGGVWRFVRHSTAKAIDLFERQSKRTKRGGVALFITQSGAVGRRVLANI